MTSKEWVKNELSYTDDHLTTNDRIMLNKVLQDLELLEEYRNFNNEVVLDTLEKERLIIEENKKLKEENEKLKARCKAIPPLAIRNEKLTKAIEILLGENGAILLGSDNNHKLHLLDYDLVKYYISKEEYELLKEVLGE